MADEAISTENKFADVSANVTETDQPTPVLTWDVPTGTKITVTEGHAAMLAVEQVGGGNLPRGTRLGLAYREPNQLLGQWNVISETEISPFNNLGLKAQESGDNAQRRRFSFDGINGGSITLEDADELALVVVSTAEVDPATLYFHYPAVVQQG